MNSARNKVRIGISGSYGGLNLGDEAILEAIIKQLRESLPVEITVFTRDPGDTCRRHDPAHAVACRELTREEARAEVEKLDLLILGGGGILYDRDVDVYLREVSLAHEIGVPVFVYAVSAGPLDDPENRKSVAQHLNRAAAVTVRDKQAMKLLEEIGVEKEIILTADPALLLEPQPLQPDTLKREGLDLEHRLVGFSVREPGPAAPDIDVEHYHALLAGAADFMVARLDASIVFVPLEQKKSDVQHSHAVVSRMQFAQRATVLKGEYTSGELLSLIGHFQFSIGMRLHFLIFSAIQQVPFVALPYASKVVGFIEDLQMPMPPLSQVSAGSLMAHIDRSWDTQGVLRKRIIQNMTKLKDRARETNRILLRLLQDISLIEQPGQESRTRATGSDQ
jgi:polysaccharide pyruvyl transferase CsaB